MTNSHIKLKLKYQNKRIKIVKTDERLDILKICLNQLGIIIAARHLSNDDDPQLLIKFDSRTDYVSVVLSQVEVI